MISNKFLHYINEHYHFRKQKKMSHLSYFRTFLLFILFLLAQGFLHRGIVADQKEVLRSQFDFLFFFYFGFFVYLQVLKNAYFECDMIKTQFCLIFCMSIIIYQSLTLSHKNLVILSCSYKTFSEYIYKNQGYELFHIFPSVVYRLVCIGQDNIGLEKARRGDEQ